jgi:hypothetical protein
MKNIEIVLKKEWENEGEIKVLEVKENLIKFELTRPEMFDEIYFAALINGKLELISQAQYKYGLDL